MPRTLTGLYTVELSEEERRHIASHLRLPTYTKKEEAELAHGIAQLLGYEATLEETDFQHMDFPGWLVIIPGFEA